MELRELSWADFQERDPTVAVLPVSSTENHGPHLPLGTDSIFANNVAREACERTDELLLPSLEFGVAEHHRKFPGTLYVSADTLRDVVYETLHSLTEHGIEKAVIINGHGGNTGALNQVCGRLARDGDMFVVHWIWTDGFPGEEDHAGKNETSFVMHLRPNLVGDLVEGADEWGNPVNGTLTAQYTHEFAENGIVGDPKAASEEHGEEFFEACLDHAVELIEHVRDLERDYEALEQFSPSPE